MRQLRMIPVSDGYAPDPMYAISGPVAATFARAGYVCFDDRVACLSSKPSCLIFTMYPPARISFTQFTEELRPYVVAELRRLAADPEVFKRDAADAARMADRLAAHDADAYLRTVASYTRERLPDIRTGQAIALADAARTTHRSKTPAEQAATRARRKEAARARTAAALPKWLALHVEPGRYDVADLWDRWSTEVIPALRDKAPELADLGRNGFYEVLAEVAEVRKGGGHRRYITVT